MAAITKEAAELYDRQIRLWGEEAQKRLLRARVLVFGINGATVEAAKNLILGGFRVAFLLDPTLVGPDDLQANFFVSADDVGKLSRAEATRPKMAELNAIQNDAVVVIKNKSVVEAIAEGDYNAVIGSGLSKQELIQIDDACLSVGASFFAVDVFGCMSIVISRDIVKKGSANT